MESDIAISVIVPVYKVERFISRCANSLFSQSMRNRIEFIFVDDASPDKSIDILEQCLAHHSERRMQVKILHHTKNLGLPAARNTGLKVANGEYVYHCDSDDFLEIQALEQMYATIREHDADIVWCDWFLSLESSERLMPQPSYDTPTDALKGMLAGAMKYNVWNKLVRRSLYTDNNIMFPSGHGMGEDMTMLCLFACADNVCHCHQPLYHYVRQNTEAFTRMDRQMDACHLADLYYNVESTVEFLIGKYGHELDKELSFFLLETKFPFLLTNSKASYLRWREWFPDVNRFIWQNKQISFRSRLLQYMAEKRQFWYVRLYHFILFRIIYGVIYK